MPQGSILQPLMLIEAKLLQTRLHLLPFLAREGLLPRVKRALWGVLGVEGPHVAQAILHDVLHILVPCLLQLLVDLPHVADRNCPAILHWWGLWTTDEY